MNLLKFKTLGFVLAQTAFIATLQLPAAAEARNCVKGKACGNSCISQNDVCHVGTGAATTTTTASVNAPTNVPPNVPATQTRKETRREARRVSKTVPNAPTSRDTSSAMTSSADTAPAAAAAPMPPAVNAKAAKERHCNKGKACGNSCIPANAVCHAQ